MEATILCWGYIGIMGNKMETSIVHFAVPTESLILVPPVGVKTNRVTQNIVLEYSHGT